MVGAPGLDSKNESTFFHTNVMVGAPGLEPWTLRV